MIRLCVRLALSADCPRLAGIEAKCAQAVRSDGRSRDCVPTYSAVSRGGPEIDLGSSWVRRSPSFPHQQSRTASRCATGLCTLEGAGCVPWAAPSGEVSCDGWRLRVHDPVSRCTGVKLAIEVVLPGGAAARPVGAPRAPTGPFRVPSVVCRTRHPRRRRVRSHPSRERRCRTARRAGSGLMAPDRSVFAFAGWSARTGALCDAALRGSRPEHVRSAHRFT